MTLESLRAEMEAKANLATALLAQSLHEVERLSGEVERRQQAMEAQQAQLHAMANSLSWKLTAPLRKIWRR